MKTRENYTERTNKRMKDFAQGLNLTPVFDKLREVTGIKDMKFEISVSEDRSGTPRVQFESNNVINHAGIWQLGAKELTIGTFSNGISTTAPSYYDDEEIDYTKDYDIYYWATVNFHYKHHDGGSNGTEIAVIRFANGEWTFGLRSENTKPVAI